MYHIFILWHNVLGMAPLWFVIWLSGNNTSMTLQLHKSSLFWGDFKYDKLSKPQRVQPTIQRSSEELNSSHSVSTETSLKNRPDLEGMMLNFKTQCKRARLLIRLFCVATLKRHCVRLLIFAFANLIKL